MTPQRAKELLPVITAFAEGKTVQVKSGEKEWADCADPQFNYSPELYRIKPEPRVIWVNGYPDRSANCILPFGKVYDSEQSAREGAYATDARQIKFIEAL